MRAGGEWRGMGCGGGGEGGGGGGGGCREETDEGGVGEFQYHVTDDSSSECQSKCFLMSMVFGIPKKNKKVVRVF